MTYTWDLNPLTVYTTLSSYDNVVCAVNWTINAQQNSNGVVYTTFSKGQVSLDVSTLSGFTPYAQLTQDQVLSWIMPYINLNDILAQLQNNLDTQMAPPIANLPPPWAG